jgi:hypothetical protein
VAAGGPGFSCFLLSGRLVGLALPVLPPALGLAGLASPGKVQPSSSHPPKRKLLAFELGAKWGPRQERQGTQLLLITQSHLQAWAWLRCRNHPGWVPLQLNYDILGKLPLRTSVSSSVKWVDKSRNEKGPKVGI